MKTRNITPIIKAGALITWLMVSSMVIPIYVPETTALLAASSVAILGAAFILWLLNGDRIWIRNGRHLPIGVMIKPRGYSMSSALSDGDGTAGREALCVSCGNTFDATLDHFRSDSSNYCPSCSRIGEVVMDNYHEWFETTEDVRETASS